MICPQCGTGNGEHSANCTLCGTDPGQAPAHPAPPSPLAVCLSCGDPVQPGTTLCSRCLGARLDTIKGGPKISRNDRVVAARISNKERQLRHVSLVGPTITAIVGVFCCLAVIKTIMGAIIGIPLIIFATWWAGELIMERKKIKVDIEEFQKQFD